MKLGKIVRLRIENFPRRYALIEVRGQRKLACYLNEEWVIDSTCKGINDMLAEGVVGEEAVQGWIDLQPATSH